MLANLRERLVPPDILERHMIVARLLYPHAVVVDVGGTRGGLEAFMEGAAVTTVNVAPDADIVVPPGPERLPFADHAFVASASVDTLEHIPRDDRALFVAELLRVARRRAVLCCPLGTPARREIELADNAWYRETAGVEHPWIAEHLEHGPPTADELRTLFDSRDHHVQLWFHGDVAETSRQLRLAETSNRTRNPADLGRWVAFRLPYRMSLALEDEPSPTTNRVFIVAERRDR